MTKSDKKRKYGVCNFEETYWPIHEFQSKLRGGLGANFIEC